MQTRLPAALALVTTATVFTACDSPESFFGGSLATFGVLGLIALVLIIVAIVDLVKRPMDITQKVIWGLVIFFLPLIGSILYLVIGRK